MANRCVAVTPALYVEPTSVGSAVRQRGQRWTTLRSVRRLHVNFALGFLITNEMLRSDLYGAYGLS